MAQRIHPFFLAYLFLRRWAAEQGTPDDIQPDWDGMAAYIRVDGGPPGKPYLRPLWHGKSKDPGRYWLNPNIAGSFSPSSLRELPRNVIDTSGSHFSLRDEHPRLALEHFLYGKSVSAIAFAAYLYRDFGFTKPSLIEIKDLVLLLRQDFHYTSDDGEFATLFTVEAPPESAVAFDFFEPLTPDTPGVE